MTEEQQQMIEDCKNRDSKLSSWEFDFIESIEDQGSLSKRQAEILEEIWDRVT